MGVKISGTLINPHARPRSEMEYGMSVRRCMPHRARFYARMMSKRDTWRLGPRFEASDMSNGDADIRERASDSRARLLELRFCSSGSAKRQRSIIRTAAACRFCQSGNNHGHQESYAPRANYTAMNKFQSENDGRLIVARVRFRYRPSILTDHMLGEPEILSPASTEFRKSARDSSRKFAISRLAHRQSEIRFQVSRALRSVLLGWCGGRNFFDKTCSRLRVALRCSVNEFIPRGRNRDTEAREWWRWEK